jgi:hypothetical protein
MACKEEIHLRQENRKKQVRARIAPTGDHQTSDTSRKRTAHNLGNNLGWALLATHNT